MLFSVVLHMFQFKQFRVRQQQTTMKVNTDGVLLGAWVNVSEAKTILDIGTATGVIALMLAQKNADAKIDALEIDKKASEEAQFNFQNSVFAERLRIFNSSLQTFVSDKRYDVIVSNPPYFVDNLKPENTNKIGAKHTVSLSYEELIFHAEKLLSENGKFFVVIPFFNMEILQKIARKNDLFLTEVCRVAARTNKPFYLALLQFERTVKPLRETTLTIQNSDNTFTKEYISLTRDFYLRME